MIRFVSLNLLHLLADRQGETWLTEKDAYPPAPPRFPPAPALEAIGIAALPVSRDGYLVLRPELRLQVLLEVPAQCPFGLILAVPATRKGRLHEGTAPSTSQEFDAPLVDDAHPAAALDGHSVHSLASQ